MKAEVLKEEVCVYGYVSIRKSACYYSKVQAPAYIHNRRNAHKINKEVEKTFALVDNSNMTVSYN